MLRSLQLLTDRIPAKPAYRFTVPAIHSLRTLSFPSRVTCFAGENGSGKSTLLEAIAGHIGFGREGGNRNFTPNSTEANLSTEPLTRALRLSWDRHTGEGFYLRAESMFNIATYVDQIGGTDSFGGRSLHDRSHGETFFTVLHSKFRRSGLFLLDEPEAALTPQRQLALIALMHSTLRDHRDAQFILSTHSPILLGYPEAQILSFDNGVIHPVPYTDTDAYIITRQFPQRTRPLARRTLPTA